MKKAKALILVLACMFSLVGCVKQTPGGNTEGNANTTDNQNIEPADDGEMKVAFIFGTLQLDFYAYMAAAAKYKAEQLGMTVDLYDGQGDLAQKDANFDQVMALGYDCIIIVGEEASITAVREANAMGIPVVCVDMMLDEGEYIAQIESDNTGMGETLGQLTVDYLIEKNGSASGKVFYLESPGSPIQGIRSAGYLSVLEQHSEIEVEQLVLESYLAEPTERQVNDLLIREPEGTIDVIMGCNAGGSLGGLAAVISAGRNEIAVIGIDDEDGQILALKDENNPYIATMAQSSINIGMEGVQAAYDYLTDGTVIGEKKLECTLVTKDNVEDYVSSVAELKQTLEAYLP